MRTKETFEQVIYDPGYYELLGLDQDAVRDIRRRFNNNKISKEYMEAHLFLLLEKLKEKNLKGGKFRPEDWKLPKIKHKGIKNLGKKLKAKPKNQTKLTVKKSK